MFVWQCLYVSADVLRCLYVLSLCGCAEHGGGGGVCRLPGTEIRMNPDVKEQAGHTSQYPGHK